MVRSSVPLALTQKVPSSHSAEVLPSPRMTRSRSGRPSSRDISTSVGKDLLRVRHGSCSLDSRNRRAAALPRSAQTFW